MVVSGQNVETADSLLPHCHVLANVIGREGELIFDDKCDHILNSIFTLNTNKQQK